MTLGYLLRPGLGYGFHPGEYAACMAALALGVWGLGRISRGLGRDGTEMVLGAVAVLLFLLMLLGR